MGKKRVKWDIEKVKQYFEDHDCELLEKEYKNNKTLMRYRCKCRNEKCKITFNNFKRGHRCEECGIKKKTGENNYNYNPNLTNEERKYSRPGCDKWRRLILERDNNTCQCCFRGF